MTNGNRTSSQREIEDHEAMKELKEYEGKILDDEFIDDFALSGEYVKNLKDKHFLIVSTRTILGKDLDNPSQFKKKTILKVKLADGTIVDYYPNKTSKAVIIGKKGYRLADWVGYKGEFYTEEQKVGKVKRNVVYIAE